MLSKLNALSREQQQAKPCGQVSRLTLANLRRKLGDGPMRFSPSQPSGGGATALPLRERTTKDQIESLSAAEKDVFNFIRYKWQSRKPEMPLSDDLFLRFARCSLFNDREAWRTMKKYNKHIQQLTAEQLEPQLRSKTCFPVPQLCTKRGGYEVCYMRLSRHAAKTSSNNSVSILENVAYVLSTMMEREVPCTKGICVMFNMKDFGMSNFATDYWFQLMALLQGQKVPVRVNLLLIVNAPDWFHTSIWKIMKPMLSADFSKRVKMIYESELSKNLAQGFEQYLPNEMSSGQACTDEMVNDFCEYRKAVEAAQGHGYSSENTINTNTTPRTAVSRSNSTRRFDLSVLQPSMMSETYPAPGSSVPAPDRTSGIPRSVSCLSLASDCIKSLSSSNHNSRRSGMQRQASCQSISKSAVAATAAATKDSPRRKPKQQNQRNLPPQSPDKRSMLLSPPSMPRRSLSESYEESYSPRNLPPQSPNKRSMLLSPSMPRQSLSAESCEVSPSPRNLPLQSPDKRSSLLSPSMRRQSLSAESCEESYSPRNLPPQSPDKRSIPRRSLSAESYEESYSPRNLPPQSPDKHNMLLSPAMRRQASCHSLSVDSCEVLYSPRKRLPRQWSSSMLRSSPSKQPSSRNLVLQDKLGMPSLDNSCTSIATSIASDMTEEAFTPETVGLESVLLLTNS